MRRKPWLPIALILSLTLLTLLAGACIPYRPFTLPNEEFETLQRQDPQEAEKYRKSVRPCTDLTEFEGDARLTRQCTFAVIEFDDQGEFWKPEQLTDALTLIERHSTRQGDPKEALVVVFVHGWKNNASLDNELNRNLGSFKKVLIRLAQEELRRDEAKAVRGRPVIGVYLSWRGRTSNNWIASQVSFFNRKSAAERVARVSFSHAVQRLVASTKGTKSDTRGNPNSVAVVVGHSFGGLIVENTLLRTLTIETNDFSEFGADLAVLVNPANEAILARQFVHALSGAPPRRLQLGEEIVSQPLIVSVTSVGDSATGKLFPFAQTFNAINKRFHDYEDDEPGVGKQTFYFKHTPGHSTSHDKDGALFSHALNCPLEPNEVCRDAPETPEAFEQAMARTMERMRAKEQAQTIFPPPAVRLGECRREPETRRDYRCIDNLWFVGAATGQLYGVNRALSSPNQTGYWILPLPTTIVASHSDIFQSELASLLAAFINLKDARVVEDLEGAEEYLKTLYPGDP